jgi:tRNA threonylcarbamoyladenosine biosynthesis protein TsaB
VKGTWIAFDTATDVASVAIGSADGSVVSRVIRGTRQQAAQIIPTVQELLQVTNTSLAQVDGFIVGDGPGSFTGLRIGWAAAIGLSHVRRLPVIAVPSLLGAAHAAGVSPVAACYDALRGQVFGAVYAFGDNRVKTLMRPELFTVSALAARTPVRPVNVVGDGAERYRDEVFAWTGREPVGLAALPPIAGSLIALASLAGYPPSREPVYGRPAEAQVKWETRHGRPLPHSSR